MNEWAGKTNATSSLFVTRERVHFSIRNHRTLACNSLSTAAAAASAAAGCILLTLGVRDAMRFHSKPVRQSLGLLLLLNAVNKPRMNPITHSKQRRTTTAAFERLLVALQCWRHVVVEETLRHFS